MTSNELVYWDTCIFLAWIKEEARAPGELSGAQSVADEVFKNQVRLLTSVITKAEISLLDELNPAQMDKFGRIFARRNVIQADVTERIAMKAAELRQHYRKTPKSAALSFADAIHLATAILYKASVFHTFDGKRSKTVKVKQDFLTLLPLDKNVAGYPLRIEMPRSEQPSFDLPPGRVS